MQITQCSDISTPNLEYIISKLTPKQNKSFFSFEKYEDVKLKPEDSFGLIDMIKKEINYWHYKYTKMLKKQKKFVQLMSSLIENRMENYQKIKQKSEDLNLYDKIILQYQKLKILAENYKNFLIPGYSLNLYPLSQYYTTILQISQKTVSSKINQITKQPKNDTLTYFMNLVIENRDQLVEINQSNSNRNLSQFNLQQLKKQCQLKITCNILKNIRNMDQNVFKRCANYLPKDQKYIDDYNAEQKLVACCFHRMKSLMNLPTQVTNIYHFLYSQYKPSIKLQIQQQQSHQQSYSKSQQILNKISQILNLPPNPSNNPSQLIDRIHQLQNNNQILEHQQNNLEQLYLFIQKQSECMKGINVQIRGKIQEYGRQNRWGKIRQFVEDVLFEQMYGIVDRTHVGFGKGQKRDIFDILSKHTNKNITAFQLLYRSTHYNRPPIFLNQHLPTPNNLLILFSSTNINNSNPQKGCIFTHNNNNYKEYPIFINFLNDQKLKIEQILSYQIEDGNITICIQQNIWIILSGVINNNQPSKITYIRNGKQELSVELEVLEVYGVSYQNEQYIRQCQTQSINSLITHNQQQNHSKTKKILKNLYSLKSSLKQTKISTQQLLQMRQQLNNNLTTKIQETMTEINYKLNQFTSQREGKKQNDKNIAILKNQLQQVQKKNNILQMQKQRYGASIKFLKAKLDPQKLKQFQQTQFITNKEAIALRSQLQQLHQQNSQLQNNYKQSQIQFTQLQQKYKNSVQQLQKNKQILDSKYQQMQSLKEKEGEMIGEIKDLERDLSQWKQKVQLLDRSLNQGKQNISLLEKQNKQLKQQNQSHQKQIIKINQQLQTHKKQITNKKQQLSNKNQQLKKISLQLLKLTESLKFRSKSSSQQINNIQLPLQQQLQTIYQCFNGRIHLHTQIKKTIIEEIHNNFSGNIGKIRYQVSVTDLLYFYPEMGELNFHRLVDGKNNVVVVIKLREVDHVIVVFSEAMVHNKSIPPNKDQGAFMAILSNNPETSTQNKIFYLNRNNPQSRALPYNDYYLVIGNSQLRIKRGTDKAQTNIPNIFQYFKTDEFKNPYFMFGDNKTTAEVQRYDIYQVTITKIE